MTERYKVIEGSVSYHCCFDATVVDTYQASCSSAYRTERYGFDFVQVCECFELEDAQRICDALNGAQKLHDALTGVMTYAGIIEERCGDVETNAARKALEATK